MQVSHFPAPSRTGHAVLFLIVLGAAAGFVNGLLGTGGGIVLVYVMRRYTKLYPTQSALTSNKAQRDVYATALSVMLPVSVFSAFHYVRAGALDFSAFSPMLMPSVIGGVLGGWLLDKLRLSWLKRLFALLVLVSGILMIIRA